MAAVTMPTSLLGVLLIAALTQMVVQVQAVLEQKALRIVDHTVLTAEKPRMRATKIFASEASIEASSPMTAAEHVNQHAHAWKAPSDCNAVDGKGLFEKYGQAPLGWTQYCNDNAGNSSWLKCAGQNADYLCIGANLGLKGSGYRTKNAVMSVSGCTWAAGKGNIILDQQYQHQLNLSPDPAKGACTAGTSRKGHFIVMSLVDTWNPYEGMHQPLMAFATIAKLGLKPDQVRLVYVSIDAKRGESRKMDDFVVRVLSRGGSALHLDKESSLCLENVILPIPGGLSPALNNRGFNDPTAAKCSASPVFLGFADYVKDAFAVQQVSLNAVQKLRITLTLRKSSTEHEQAYNRQMSNADQLEESLRVNLHETKVDAEAAVDAMLQQFAAKLRSTGHFDVRVAVPPSMTIEEQVVLFSNTDVLMAPHGASLTWQILQPECSQVIEFCSGRLHHFENLAHYLGKKHTCQSGPAGWGAPSFSADVSATLKRVKEIKEEWQSCRAKL